VAAILFDLEIVALKGQLLVFDFSGYDAKLFSKILYSAVVFFAIYTLALIPNFINRYSAFLYDSYIESRAGEFIIRDRTDKALSEDEDRISRLIERHAKQADTVIDAFNKRQREAGLTSLLSNIGEHSTAGIKPSSAGWIPRQVDLDNQAATEIYVNQMRETIRVLTDSYADVREQRRSLLFNAERRLRTSVFRKWIFYFGTAFVDILRVGTPILLGIFAVVRLF